MALKPRYGQDLPDVYAVFGTDQYYPGGGWSDFKDAFETLEEARAFARRLVDPDAWRMHGWCNDYAHIVNLTTLSLIEHIDQEEK